MAAMAMRSTEARAAPTDRTGGPWWVTLVDGVAMSIVGALLLLAPGLTTVALVRFLGLFWLIDGIVSLVSLCVDRSGWGWKVVGGVLGIVAGLAVLEHPLWSAVLVPAVLVSYVAIVGVCLGMLKVVMAFRGAGWTTGIFGTVSIAFGLLLLFSPLAGALALPTVVGAVALVGGIVTAISSLLLPLLVRSSGRS